MSREGFYLASEPSTRLVLGLTSNAKRQQNDVKFEPRENEILVVSETERPRIESPDGLRPIRRSRTYDLSIVRQRQTEGDTPLQGGGKISTSPQGCQSAVGREVKSWPRRKRLPRRLRRRAARRRSKSTIYEEPTRLLWGPAGPPFFCLDFSFSGQFSRPDPTPTISTLI